MAKGGKGEVRLGGIFVDAEMRLKKFNAGAKELDQKLGKLQGQFGRSGRALTNTLSIPLAALGGAALLSAQQVDQAFATIRRGTGATGTALKGLQNDFRAVFTQVPESAGKVGTAIADLNTRLGLSGKPLQEISKQVIELARITNTDLSSAISSSTRVFGDWSVTNEDASEALDTLFKVTQTTGVGLDKLNRTIVQYGAPLRLFGFQFEEAAALIGKFEKEGVNTEIVFSGLRQAMGRLTDAGVPLDTGLQAIFSRLKELSNTEAIDLGRKVFGAEAGADFAAAVREGRFEIDELVKKISESSETVGRAAAESKTFTEALGELRNAFTAVLESFGTEIIAVLIPQLQTLAGVTRQVAEAFSELDPATRKAIIVIGALAAALGPSALLIRGTLATIRTFKFLVPVLALTANKFTAVALAAAAAGKVIESQIDEDGKLVRGIRIIQEYLSQLESNPSTASLRGAISAVTAEVNKEAKAVDDVAKSYERLQAKKALVADVNDLISSRADLFGSGSFVPQIGGGDFDDIFAKIDASISKGTKAGAKAGLSDPAITIDFEKNLKSSFENSTDFFRNAFENAITGVRFSLEDTLGQVAVGFAASIAAELSGNFNGGDGTPQGFGAQLGQGLISIFNGGGSGFNPGAILQGAFGDSSSIGPVADGSQYAGMLQGSQISGAAGAFAAAQAVQSIQKLGQSSEETTQALTELGGTGIGAFFGGPVGAAIGGQIGKVAGSFLGESLFGGPTNPETLARIGVVSKLEELIDKVGGISFIDGAGKLQNINDIRLGSSGRFNNLDQAAVLNSTGNAGAFGGVGNLLTEFFDVEEKIGSQLGVILAESFGGSIEGLKALVDTLGISLEDARESLLNIGRTGEESWLSIISQVNELEGLYADGIEGLGKYEQAAKNLYQSAGRGQIALNQLQNLAIEGQEAGIVSVEGLVQRLAATGEFSSEYLEGLFSALSQQGISTLDELAEASDLTLARVVAAIDAYLQDNGQNWDEQIKKINEYDAALDEINNKRIKVQLDIVSNADADAQRLLDGGILPSVDASAPFQTSAAKLSSGEGTTQARSSTINIDARGAGPGVEEALFAVADDLANRINERISSQL